MRAERDQDEYRPSRKAEKQPRLAYEIALGIILGGCVLMTIADVKDWVAARVIAQEIQISFGR